jgi:hypothetical protein
MSTNLTEAKKAKVSAARESYNQGRLARAPQLYTNLKNASLAFSASEFAKQPDLHAEIAEKIEALAPFVGQVPTPVINQPPKVFFEISNVITRKYNGKILDGIGKKWAFLASACNNLYDVCPDQGDAILTEIMDLCLQGVQVDLA